MKIKRFTSISAILTISLLASSSTLLTTSKANARPCGSDWFSKIGCGLDPTNPARNGGVVGPVVQPILTPACAVGGTAAGGPIGGVMAASLCGKVLNTEEDANRAEEAARKEEEEAQRS